MSLFTASLHPNTTTISAEHPQAHSHVGKANLAQTWHISPFKKWANLVIPQLVNGALTAGFVFLGAVTNSPWLITSTAISGAIQAVSLGRAWHVSKGTLGAAYPSIWATITSISAAFFGNIMGGTSSLAKILIGSNTAVTTLASLWAVRIAAEEAKARVKFEEIKHKIIHA